MQMAERLVRKSGQNCRAHVARFSGRRRPLGNVGPQVGPGQDIDGLAEAVAARGQVMQDPLVQADESLAVAPAVLAVFPAGDEPARSNRSEAPTSEIQSLMRN